MRTIPLSTSFPNIPGIRYGFGNSRNLVPPELHALNADWPVIHQTHSTLVTEIVDPGATGQNVDGLMTALPRVVLSVMTADCVPILFARQDGKRVAAVHAGWRGLTDGIISTLARLIRTDGDVGDWLALIGPSAGLCCYEVGSDFLDRFSVRCGLPIDILAGGSKTHLDLQAVARIFLQDAGFGFAGQINECTMCAVSAGEGQYRFNSYRRNVKAQPDPRTRSPIPNQLSGIVIL